MGYSLGVHIVLPKDTQEKIDRSSAQALLYCPLDNEISNEIDWFEKEMAADSVTHQLLSIVEYERQQSIVRYNLLKDPFPIWEQAKKKWMDTDNLELEAPDVYYEVPKNPREIDNASFAPQKGP